MRIVVAGIAVVLSGLVTACSGSSESGSSVPDEDAATSTDAAEPTDGDVAEDSAVADVGVSGKCRNVGDVYVADEESLEALRDVCRAKSLTISAGSVASLRALAKLESVEFGLTIENCDALTNLDGLEMLRSVGGRLTITGNDALASLTGFASLTSAGGLEVSDNAVLKDFSGLETLTSLTAGEGADGAMYVASNPQMTSFAGLVGLVSIDGSLKVSDAAKLSTFAGLENLGVIGGDFVLGPGVTDLSALSKLTTIGGSFVAQSVTSLTSLDGLTALESVGSRITIEMNPALASLHLDALKHVGGFFSVAGNTVLADVRANALVDAKDGLYVYDNLGLTTISMTSLESIGGTTGLALHGNRELVSASFDALHATTWFEAFYETKLSTLKLGTPLAVAGDVIVQGNAALTDLTGFSGLGSVSRLHVEANDALTTLDGLEGLTHLTGDLRIQGNAALVSFQGLKNVTKVDGSVTIKNAAASSLAGLGNLTTIGGGLEVTQNAVTTLSGLDALTTIGGTLTIDSNAQLGTLSALSALSSAGGTSVVIQLNFLLPACEAKALATRLGKTCSCSSNKGTC